MKEDLQALAYQCEIEHREYEELKELEADYKVYLEDRRYEPVTGV